MDGGEAPATGKLGRSEFKRLKAIEEQRKAGTIPAEVDPETGRDINPHIPHYISQAPWYLEINHPTLKHQRVVGEEEAADAAGINDWYARGAKAGPAAKKFRKGACENCGAMTHKTKDCMDRPRQKGAKFTKKDIAPDEVVTSLNLGFEAKRDRWNGYDPTEHGKIVEEWELIEKERRLIREQKVKEKMAKAAAKQHKQQRADGEVAADADGDAEKAGEKGDGNESGGGSDAEDDDDKYADAADAVGQKLDAKTRTTVRNLRIREDTAKYLLNLDVNSAYYDPKTRSMRENPLADKDPSDLTYAGDNFVRWTGDAPKMAKLQMFAWQAEDRGKDVNLTANPTQGELLFQEYQKKKEKVSDSQKTSILAKYGGEEHLEAPPKELLLAQTESYVEYSQTGKVIKGQEKAKVLSRYQEDVFFLNHTAVWGSFWRDGRWGYACCHLFSKAAYCTGREGIEAEQASSEAVLLNTANHKSTTSGGQRSLLETHLQKSSKELAASAAAFGAKKRPRGERLGEGDVAIDNNKLAKALQAEEKLRDRNDDDAITKKKRGKYMSVAEEKEITEEELEAYRLKKSHHEDPMAKFNDLDDDE